MSCPHCKNTAITGLLNGCSIIEVLRKEQRAKQSTKHTYFTQKVDDPELDKLIDEVSTGVKI